MALFTMWCSCAAVAAAVMTVVQFVSNVYEEKPLAPLVEYRSYPDVIGLEQWVKILRVLAAVAPVVGVQILSWSSLLFQLTTIVGVTLTVLWLAWIPLRRYWRRREEYMRRLYIPPAVLRAVHSINTLFDASTEEDSSEYESSPEGDDAPSEEAADDARTVLASSSPSRARVGEVEEISSSFAGGRERPSHGETPRVPPGGEFRGLEPTVVGEIYPAYVPRPNPNRGASGAERTPPRYQEKAAVGRSPAGVVDAMSRREYSAERSRAEMKRTASMPETRSLAEARIEETGTSRGNWDPPPQGPLSGAANSGPLVEPHTQPIAEVPEHSARKPAAPQVENRCPVQTRAAAETAISPAADVERPTPLPAQGGDRSLHDETTPAKTQSPDAQTPPAAAAPRTTEVDQIKGENTEPPPETKRDNPEQVAQQTPPALKQSASTHAQPTTEVPAAPTEAGERSLEQEAAMTPLATDLLPPEAQGEEARDTDGLQKVGDEVPATETAGLTNQATATPDDLEGAAPEVLASTEGLSSEAQMAEGNLEGEATEVDLKTASPELPPAPSNKTAQSGKSKLMRSPGIERKHEDQPGENL